MPHVVLLGDSVFDNASYTAGEPDVISQVRQLLPQGWNATLCAIDGSTTEEISKRLESLPQDSTHLALSVGGNNALLREDILERPVTSTGEAFHLLSLIDRPGDLIQVSADRAQLADGVFQSGELGFGQRS